jgi:hypothetical protein
MRPEDQARAKLMEEAAAAAGHANETSSSSSRGGGGDEDPSWGAVGGSSVGSTRWSKESLHSCYCFNLINEMTTNLGLLEGVYSVYTSNGDVCTSQLYQFLLAKVINFSLPDIIYCFEL